MASRVQLVQGQRHLEIIGDGFDRTQRLAQVVRQVENRFLRSIRNRLRLDVVVRTEEHASGIGHRVLIPSLMGGDSFITLRRARGQGQNRSFAIFFSKRMAVNGTLNETVSTTAIAPRTTSEGTVVRILLAISFCHLLNDMVQSLIPAVYPILKSSYHLDFGHIGLI